MKKPQGFSCGGKVYEYLGDDNLEDKYCCKEFEYNDYHLEFDEEERRWDIIDSCEHGDEYIILKDIKFCPFCGKKL